MSLAGLLIWDWWDPALLAGGAPAFLLKELQRLRQLETQTLDRLRSAFRRSASTAPLLDLLQSIDTAPRVSCSRTDPCLPRIACTCSGTQTPASTSRAAFAQRRSANSAGSTFAPDRATTETNRFRLPEVRARQRPTASRPKAGPHLRHATAYGLSTIEKTQAFGARTSYHFAPRRKHCCPKGSSQFWQQLLPPLLLVRSASACATPPPPLPVEKRTRVRARN